MPRFKDLMHALLNEDVDDEFEEEDEIVEEPIQQDTFVTPTINTQPVEEVTYDFAMPEVEAVVEEPNKPSIFDGMDIDEVAKAPVKTTKIKEYRYDRSKIQNKTRRVQEDLEYSPVISPIFGNTKDEKKQFEKVHDAINLQKPADDFTFTQVISPMYGNKIPQPKPVDEIPVKKVAQSEPMELSEMIEKPNKEKNKQKKLFED